jgi:toxin ParE1/3/4
MAYEITWTDAAREDLAGILDFIAKDSLQNALAVADKIESSLDRLVDFPQSGHPVEDVDGAFREVVVFQYRVIYRVLAAEIEVIAVIHGARRFPEAMDGRA